MHKRADAARSRFGAARGDDTMIRNARPILGSGITALAALCLQGLTAYAQQGDPPKEAPPPSREQQLEDRVAELEKRLAAVEEKEKEPSATDEIGETTVDPDLAAAAAADASASAAPGPETIDAVQPIISPTSSMNPDLSIILDVGAAWFGDADHLTQGGHAIDDNGIALQGCELAASASVDPYFRFDMNFQLTEAELEEVYLTTLALPLNLQARAGLMNAAFGRENAMHLHVWNFANPPLSHTRFMGEEHMRGPGVELSALLPLPWYLNLIGQAFDTAEALGFGSATFGSSEQTSAGRINGLEDFLYVVRMENFFELSANWSLLIGFSEGFGQSPYEADARTYLHGGDLYLKWRPISQGEGEFALALTIEYLLRDEPYEIIDEATGVTTETGRFRDHGGYAQLDALLTKRWMLGFRFDTTDLWTGRSPDPEAVPGWQRRGSASLTFLPTHFSKLRLQGDLVRDEAREGFGYAIFLQAEVSAGEHGAHKF
jgi:hypothetical protein